MATKRFTLTIHEDYTGSICARRSPKKCVEANKFIKFNQIQNLCLSVTNKDADLAIVISPENATKSSFKDSSIMS